MARRDPKAHKPITAYFLQPEQLQLPQPEPQQPAEAVGQDSSRPAQPQDAQNGQPQEQAGPQPQEPQPAQPSQEVQLVALPLVPILEARGIQALKMRKYSPKVDCPRCGGKGRIYVATRGKRKYIYVKHRGGATCYLGPADNYIVVQKVLGHLALTNLSNVSYAEVVASAAEKLLEQIEKVEENDERRIAEIIDALTDIAYVIRDACHSLGDKRSVCLEEAARALFS